MSLIKKSIALLILFLTALPLYSSIAVIPYRVSPGAGISSEEYAKILSVTALLIKEIEVQSPHETAIGLRELGLKADSLSAEDLDIFGNKYNLSYLLIGTLARKDGNFVSENILYSVKGRQIISRSTSSDRHIFRTAEKSIKSSLISTGDISYSTAENEADIAVIIDLSYNINSEWSDIKKAVSAFTSEMIEKHGINTRIYILPYSDRRSFNSAKIYINSITELKRGLDSISPAGSPDKNNLSKVLNYSIRNIKWRASAIKRIIIINSSSTEGLTFPEKPGFEAKQKKIIIDTISGAGVENRKSDLERLSDITGGTNYSVVYQQSAFDASGTRHEIYLERSRIFTSASLHNHWQRGIISTLRGAAKGSPSPEEIYLNRTKPAPDRMTEILAESLNRKILQKEAMSTNMNHLFNSISSRINRGNPAPFAGKALIYSGNVPIWIKVPGDKLMAQFENLEQRGFYHTAPFFVRRAPSEPMGIELIPLDKNIEKGYIPLIGIADTGEIIKKSEQYTTGGIGSPPLWFIEFKVERTERFGLKRDIRDQP